MLYLMMHNIDTPAPAFRQNCWFERASGAARTAIALYEPMSDPIARTGHTVVSLTGSQGGLKPHLHAREHFPVWTRLIRVTIRIRLREGNIPLSRQIPAFDVNVGN